MKLKILWSFVAIAAAVAAMTGIADVPGERYADAALKRALVTFAVARTLNGVISVAQGTEVAVEPAGVGVTFTLGQVLDPINDLVERFSGVMLVAASSLGLQSVLLGIAGWWGINVLVLAAGAYVLVSIWSPNIRPMAVQRAIRVLLVTMFLRFAVAVMIICTNLVFDTFLANEQSAATAALESTRGEIEEFSRENEPPPQEDRSLAERLGTMFDESVAAMNVRQRLDDLGDRVSDTSEHVITLIVIFVLETIILPVAFLWLLVQLVKSLVARVHLRP